MERTVHLGTLRCDGSAHAGCQAACLLFWKEAWLQRVSNEPQQTQSSNGSTNNGFATNGAAKNGSPVTGRDLVWLQTTTIQSAPSAPEVCYRCQATELKKASQPLPWWKPGQYLRDIFINKEPPIDVIRGFIGATLNILFRRFLEHGYPNVSGPLKQTPIEELNLQPGEWVIVKSREEIIATLDKHGRNRGLTFDGEMLPFCGQRFRVLRRVEKILEESTGRMIKPRGTSVILENVYCTSRFRRVCPRAIYSYWREIWLRRAPAEAELSPSAESPCLAGDLQADHLVPGG
jgi:hypothetical protein